MSQIGGGQTGSPSRTLRTGFDGERGRFDGAGFVFTGLLSSNQRRF
jgi:hypothetical protein